MGDNLFNARYAQLQLNQELGAAPRLSAHANPAAVVNGEEEPYTIKCICGFIDDDGHTVLCEQCNTWQHIDCYYFPSLVVPEVHQCADCFPRAVDSTGAAQRQRQRREPLNSADDRRGRRAPSSKSHRKVRTKDNPVSATQPNGWPLHENLVGDGRQGLVRDQPPPAKRPKTSHKSSVSLNGSAPTRPSLPRERNGSNAVFAPSPPKPFLANCPPDYYSPEFIRVHHENTNFSPAHANTHLNIGVIDLLSTWLDDTNAFEEVTQGRTQGEILKFFPGPEPINDLETPVQKHIHEEPSVQFHGGHPIWPYLTVDQDIFAGNMIGEVRGTIGRLEEYKADPTNDWDRLRHPDHFVFFHPVLPIYIDCRVEGTLLRYARRSCRPNMRMETLITGEREYRFCFTANTDIPRGTEITIGWDLKSNTHLRDCLSRHSGSQPLTVEDKAYLQDSVETLMAHFGGCACEGQPEICLMDHFDHRADSVIQDQSARPGKGNRKRKSLKPTPPSLAVDDDSRAASETLAQDEELEETRSISQSSRSKTSREHTPGTMLPHDAHTNGNELSERDRKKLRQEEMLFSKLEHEKQPVPKKKKRNSGSNVNTPSVSTTKQHDRSIAQLSNPNTPAPFARARATESTSYFNQGHSLTEQSSQQTPLTGIKSRRSTMQDAPRPARPLYVDNATQTDVIDDAAASQSSPTMLRKPYIPMSQRLLRRSHLRTVQRLQDAHPKLQQAERPTDTTMEEAPASKDVITEVHTSEATEAQPNDDVEMADGDSPHGSSDVVPISPPEPEQRVASPAMTQQPLQSSHPPIKPPAPPWTSSESSTSSYTQHFRPNFRSTNLHVELPPPPLHSTSSVDSSITATPGAVSASVAQTFSGTVGAMMVSTASYSSANSLTQPSPLKKKMSLSDYTAKLKANKTPMAEKSQGFGEPGSSSPAAGPPHSSFGMADVAEEGKDFGTTTLLAEVKED